MRKYTDSEILRALRDGLKFQAPLSGTPSRYPPFRSIVEAAGIPGGEKGKGKLSRKRFIRLVMSTGNGRRDAEYLAYAAHRHGISYRDCLRRTMIPAILLADAKIKQYQGKLCFVRMEETRQEDSGHEDTAGGTGVHPAAEGGSLLDLRR